MKKSVAGLAVPILILALSACSSDDAAEPVTTPSPTDTAAVSDPAPEPEPTPDEVAPPQEPAEPEEPAEPAELEITLAPFEEPFTLSGPDADHIFVAEDQVDYAAPPSTWQIQLDGLGVNDVEVDDMPACALVWGTATLLEASQDAADAPPPSVRAFTEDRAKPLPEGGGCAMSGTGMPHGYEMERSFVDDTRVAVGETFKFSASTGPLDDMEEPYLVVLLEAGWDQVELAPPAQP